MQSLCQVIKRVAPMPSTVLIEGESGTGKELAARAIHKNSGREGAFVPINCSAMSAELLESELFGHVKGAFTGAHQSREGLFTYADGGTLFLDEIGEMPLSMQGHLLRALEERAIRPVGSNRETAVNVRIIAATNRDLAKQVEQGQFREDLYFRLNVLALRMPALRERLQDIPLLVRHLTHSISMELGVPAPQFDNHELLRLQSYPWPGNVRELKNVIERCLLLGSKPSQCLQGLMDSGDMQGGASTEGDIRLDAVEKRHILNVLDLHGGNKSAAARVLGVSRKTLERKVMAWKSSGIQEN
jgi:DNA-binding NtrC family response regulator